MTIIKKLKQQVEKEIRILVVDDETHVVSALKRILIDEPFQVDYFSDSLEAMKVIERQHYALVISDNKMPNMTGIELLTGVKSISAYTSRILLTGQTESAEAIEAFNNKVIHCYIDKPWNNADLLLQINNALNSYRYFRLKQLVDDLKKKSIETKTIQQSELQLELNQVQSQLELSKYLNTTESIQFSEKNRELSVLILESSKDVGNLLLAALKKAGANNCKIYDNSSSALDYLSGCSSIDVIISEWEDKTNTGESFLKSVKALPNLVRQPVFIAQLFSDNTNFIEAAQDAGADDCIVKPLKMDNLINKIETQVDYHQSQQSKSPLPDLSGYNVLIVNNDISVINRLSKILAREGITNIKVVKSGIAAITQMRSEHLSILFYDSKIMDPQWIDLQSQLIIKKIKLNNFIMFVTGSDGSEGFYRTSVDANPIEFLTEPYTHRRLISSLMTIFPKDQSKNSEQ